jgi:hypothetical protein
MIKTQQAKVLYRHRGSGVSVEVAAAKAGMSTKTARRYLVECKMPEELSEAHAWRTRSDPFEEVIEQVEAMLGVNPGLEGKTILGWLQEQQPGKFEERHLRTLQRRMKLWRALNGPGKEVYFPQIHHPGDLCESDFTCMNNLRVTIHGQPFEHLLYHFVLTYSNWEYACVCFSESFESLSSGLQGALWHLGGVPIRHRTDRLSAAVQNLDEQREFTARYKALLRHYQLAGEKIQARKANQNGDVEQRHLRLKSAIDQALMLRGSRDFTSRDEYDQFVSRIFNRLNSTRKVQLAEETKELHTLPWRRLETCRKLSVKVTSFCLICVDNNVYSVESRLIGERVEVRLYSEHLEVWYAQRCLERLPRLRGRGKHNVKYQHIVSWLLRKPGAFENYRYRDVLFPSTHLRMAYDWLNENNPLRAVKEYLGILDFAARNSEPAVNDALIDLLADRLPISLETVKHSVEIKRNIQVKPTVFVAPVCLANYDQLISVEYLQ